MLFDYIYSQSYLLHGEKVFSAIVFSWFIDLQPQGRYLFPSLLAFGWMLSRLRN